MNYLKFLKMRNKILKLILCIAISCSLLFCDKQDNNETRIKKINMQELSLRHLPNFILVRERLRDSLKIEYVFKRESDSINVFITVGLHSSAENAENIANNYINSISILMKAGTHNGVSIGDKMWWWPDADSNSLTNIVFIRKNALFIMSSHGFRDLKSLAKKIDEDIVTGASYITFQN
jgi:hypothetical protein